jgi:WD40 repeat protein/tRNA A-37 threonylcarbamoyl transferase component Bud32
MPPADDQSPPPEPHATASLGPGSGTPLSEIFGLDPQRQQDGVDPLQGAEIGGVRIVRFVAEGGMGRVYEGLQERPNRPVAVKVMRPGLATPSMMKRFDYEAEILARLRHPGIAQIYAAGVHTAAGPPVPYFIMEFIPAARTLTRYADDLKLTTRARLDLFRSVCDAVAHGHQRGVIHRDLKPSNILVDSSGHPKVIDFGVAKATDSDVALTTMQTDVGQLIGTLQYMGPEQLAGDPNEIDIRCDVYALGVVLYELLTGRLPYDVRQKAVFEVMRIVREEEPTPISRLDRTLRRDVAVIAGKCLEKDRTRRYPSAGELAMDVSRHLCGEPIAANPPGFLDGVTRLARRHRAAAAAVTVVFTALVAATVGISLFAARAERQRREAEAARTVADQERTTADKERRRADEASERAKTQLYQANLYRVGRMIADEDYANATAVARDLKESRADGEIPLELAHYLATLDQSSMTLNDHTDAVRSVAFSPDGTRLVTASRDGTARIWDALTGESLTCIHHPAPVSAVAYHPDGKLIATGANDGKVRLWDAGASTLAGAGILSGHKSEVTGIVFSPDGTVVATSSIDRTVRVWLLQTHTEFLTLRGHSERVQTVAFAPDGKALASAGWDYRVRLWDLENGKETMVWNVGHWINKVAFSPSGTTLAVATNDRHVQVAELRNLRDGKPQPTRLEGHRNDVPCVAFSPSGKTVATGGRDGTVRLWNAENGLPIAILVGHVGPVHGLSFSPNGERLASASFDKSTRVWDVTEPTPTVTLAGHSQWVNAVAFSPDGHWLASASWDGTARIWSVPKARVIATLRGHSARVYSVAFAPDGLTLATGSSDKTVRIWDLQTGKTTRVLPGHTGEVFCTAFSPDGSLLASGAGHPDGQLRLWSLPSCDPVGTTTPRTQFVYCVAFSPDGARIAASGGPPTPAMLFDRTGRPVDALRKVRDSMDAIGFSPNGKVLATGAHDGALQLWTASRLENPVSLSGHTSKIHGLAFTPDGSRLVTASADFTVRLWDIGEQVELLSLAYDKHMRCVACSPLGNIFVASGGDKDIHVYGLSRANVRAARLKSQAIRTRLVSLIDSLLQGNSAPLPHRLVAAREGLTVDEFREAVEMILERAGTEPPDPVVQARVLFDTRRASFSVEGVTTLADLLSSLDILTEAMRAAADSPAGNVTALETRVQLLRDIQKILQGLGRKAGRSEPTADSRTIDAALQAAEAELNLAIRKTDESGAGSAGSRKRGDSTQ